MVASSGRRSRPTATSTRTDSRRCSRRSRRRRCPVAVPAASRDAAGTLYVADTLKSRIIAIPQALTRTTPLKDSGITLTQGGHLSQPLGLTLAPNGDISTTNAGNGDLVETTPAGKQLLARGADAKAGAGSLFGVVPVPGGGGVYFVDDANNDLRLLH